MNGYFMKQKQSVVQFIKFSLVGLLNTFIALVVYYVLWWYGVNYLLANTIAWVISVLNAFYWNNKYVFVKAERWIFALFKTYISYGVSFVLGLAVLYVLVEKMAVSEAVAPVLTLCVTVPLNFLMNKFWTFRSNSRG